MKPFRINKRISQNDESKSLDSYFRDVRKIDLLSVDDEVALIQLAQQGDKKAKEKIINANLRFVISVAKQYQDQGLLLPDLINEGNIGLIESINTFDLTFGYRFISYAVHRIRMHIIKSICDNSRIVRLPHNKLSDINKLKKIIRKKTQELQREPYPEDLVSEEFPLEYVNYLLFISKETSNLESPTSNDEENKLIDTIEDSNSIKPDENSNNLSLKTDIKRSLNVLEEKKERQIIEMLFGIDRIEMNIDDVAEYFGLTKECIRQIKIKALRKIKMTNEHILSTHL
jgi:RNA polymerase primary sigma factor